MDDTGISKLLIDQILQIFYNKNCATTQRAHMMCKEKQLRRGLSLVELSIVLVILGLLISGISYGVNMITRSKLLKVGEELGKYTRTFHIFFETYGFLPGLSNGDPWAKWGTACADTEDKCNCSDMNLCSYYYGVVSTPNGNIRPIDKAWKHIRLAGLIDTPIPALSTTGYYKATAGVDAPGTAYHKNGAYFPYSDMRIRSDAGNRIFGMQYPHVLFLGKERTIPDDGLFTPRDAQYLDNKISDGNPITGRLRTATGRSYNTGTDDNNACHSSNGYNGAYDTRACIIGWDMQLPRG